MPLSSGASPDPAANFQFDIPATSLDQAIARFTEQTGLSVGMTGSFPKLRTQAVDGRMSALQALQHMLAATDLQPIAAGVDAFRLEQRTRVAVEDHPASAQPELSEVLVTATKREQDWRTLPIPMSVVAGSDILPGSIAGGSRAAMQLLAATSSTNLGPGRERQFIRGVADSAFLGSSQGTVSVQFDEARATYDGPDPDLLLIDVEQVEVLRGPQGPLYGTGALGGVFRIVPRRPDMQDSSWQSSLQLQQVQSGGVGEGADLAVNVPLIRDRMAVRGLAYHYVSPGWIDNASGDNNANRTEVNGGRLGLRRALSSAWMVDIQAVAQVSHTRDSQYVQAPRSRDRSGMLTEPVDNDFYLGSITARGSWLGHDALIATSYVSHRSGGDFDASASASLWNQAVPLRYKDRRHYKLLNQEARLWGESSKGFSWMFGASYLGAHSDELGTLESPSLIRREVLRRDLHVDEVALFGELSLPFGAGWQATAGLRGFRSALSDGEHQAPVSVVEARTSYSATPSVSLDWRSSDRRRFAYLRYARATRPGGLNLNAATKRFASDELANIDLGARVLLWDDTLSIDTTLYGTHWENFQSDYVLDNGLIDTRNAGMGKIWGLETTTSWQPSDSWRVESAFTLQHVRVAKAAVAVEDDPRLPVVPKVRWRGSVVRGFDLRDWRLQWRTDVGYVGSSGISFEQALNRRMGGYFRADSSLQLRGDALTWTLGISNLLNSRADTFSYGNPFSIRTQRQYTPLAPRTISLNVSIGK